MCHNLEGVKLTISGHKPFPKQPQVCKFDVPIGSKGHEISAENCGVFNFPRNQQKTISYLIDQIKIVPS